MLLAALVASACAERAEPLPPGTRGPASACPGLRVETHPLPEMGPLERPPMVAGGTLWATVRTSSESYAVASLEVGGERSRWERRTPEGVAEYLLDATEQEYLALRHPDLGGHAGELRRGRRGPSRWVAHRARNPWRRPALMMDGPRAAWSDGQDAYVEVGGTAVRVENAYAAPIVAHGRTLVKNHVSELYLLDDALAVERALGPAGTVVVPGPHHVVWEALGVVRRLNLAEGHVETLCEDGGEPRLGCRVAATDRCWARWCSDELVVGRDRDVVFERRGPVVSVGLTHDMVVWGEMPLGQAEIWGAMLDPELEPELLDAAECYSCEMAFVRGDETRVAWISGGRDPDAVRTVHALRGCR